MILRRATMDDAERLYRWRTDPLTRAASHQSGEFDFPSHCAWLERTLASTQRQLLIAEEDGTAVGTVRADLGEITELSWTVAPEARGRGIGTTMVRAVVQRFNGALCAQIKTENVPSQRIAAAAGFVLDHEHDGILHFMMSGNRSHQSL